MISSVVVVIHEGQYLIFQLPGLPVIIQLNDILQGTVISLDLPLGLRMVRLASDMLNPLALKILSQVPSDITGAIIREKPGTVDNRYMFYPGNCDGPFHKTLDRLSCGVLTKLPGDNIAREVVHHHAINKPGRLITTRHNIMTMILKEPYFNSSIFLVSAESPNPAEHQKRFLP
jgi:hypothetical protein